VDGISNRLTAKVEKETNARILKEYKTRGTHTLGVEFKTVTKPA
jgi:hypothetical protein